jgi:ketosteroid isomerase-like protein
MDSRSLVAAFLARWRVQDVEMTLEYTNEDIVYALYISDTALPYGGETRGKANIRNVLYAILAEFDYLKYEPTIVAVDGDVVRAQVQFIYHHRLTGENLAGSKRLVFTVRDGLIVRIEEYHDAGMVEAFMRLTAHRTRTNDLPAPPELPKRADKASKPTVRPRRVLRCL